MSSQDGGAWNNRAAATTTTPDVELVTPPPITHSVSGTAITVEIADGRPWVASPLQGAALRPGAAPWDSNGGGAGIGMFADEAENGDDEYSSAVRGSGGSGERERERERDGWAGEGGGGILHQERPFR